jgi:CheY-like chemotaxis protein
MTASRPAALIVEDQPFVGLVASDILKESGFDIFHAYDADGAVELLAEHPEIQVMLTEAELPGSVDGLELARRVARDRPKVQLVLTAAGREFAQADIPEGARVLRKPYASRELQTLVGAMTALAPA